ncbi:MAG: FtsX-like permease family protein [Candidatus Stygibacter australis]|nr:FtsX-like permease family protein [Candidatus Stygibacter australis]MDP8321169.1 FtsX-like permease family protein [Candidatus Stygibacter australis]
MIDFILKGILRDRSRSLLPIILIATGVLSTSLYYSFIRGYERISIDGSARYDTGHVKVITRAYAEELDEKPYDLCLLGAEELLADLKKDYPQLNWYERIQFGGLVDVPDAQGETIVQGESAVMAVDLSKDSDELKLLNLGDALRKGKLPTADNEVVLSTGLFKKLGIDIGNDLSLITATMYGGMAVGNYQVTGVVEFGIPVLDRGMLLMDIKDARQLLDMPNGVGEILGIYKDNEYHWNESVAISEQFINKYSDPKDEFSPVMLPLHKQGDMESMLSWMRGAIFILIGFFVFIMGLVLWNLGLINGIRRYGEMGLRLAIGEHAGHIYLSLIEEAILIGFLGSIIGTAGGVGIGYWLQSHPFDMSQYLTKATVMMSPDISADVNWFSYVVGFIPGFLATILGAGFAALAVFRRSTASLFKELEN